jgi:ABC transport system ATP-binding/permease protein
MTPLLSCQNLAKNFGPRILFDSLTFGINPGDRIGVIGANGAGKSTLLRILAKQDNPDQGAIVIRQGVHIAYVPQDDIFPAKKSICEILEDAVQHLHLDENDLEGRINRALGTIGFTDRNLTAAELSGGWRKRLAIARSIIQEPDLVLLDEPTNHLDIAGILWLEKLLKSSLTTWICISHDRYLLENTPNKIMEISRSFENGCLTMSGPYSDYLEKKSAYLDSQQAQADSMANKLRREVEWLRRGPQARATKAQYRIDAAHQLQRDLSTLEDRLRTERTTIDLSASGRATKRLVELKNITKQYGDKKVIHNCSLDLVAGMKLGILGPNGAGKSTLLRMIMGEVQPDAGEIHKATGLRVVILDQHRAELPPEQTLKRALCESGDSVVYQGRSIHVATWAKRFLFDHKQLELPIKDLSGGERARTVLARLMLIPADVIILDEPTNDLDIATLEILEEALTSFPGTLVMVSHDRYTLSEVCNCFIGIHPDGQTVAYSSYEQWESETQTIGRDSDSKTAPKTAAPKSLDQKGQGLRKGRLSYMEQREFDGMEAIIFAAESDLELAKKATESPEIAQNSAKLLTAIKALETAQNEVDRLYARWTELEEKLNP